MVSREEAAAAATKVLSRCLALPPQSDVVIFVDETTYIAAEIMLEAAIRLDLSPRLLYFSTHAQLTTNSQGLRPSFETLLDEAVAALICLNGTSGCLSFRDRVRQSALNAGCKVAHMPGITLDTLLLADTDYALLTERCEWLALALANAQEVEIITKDHNGDEHHLRIPLDPWQRLPIISDGIIQRGSWGNVPSGETYIAPPEGLATGSIVINGSLPDYPLSTNEEILLCFRDGRLTDHHPYDSRAVQHLLRTQIDFARAKVDPNWATLAEVGLGANPRIQTLTGIPLLDEKKYGSVHIALGDNIDMGGQTQSEIHCDMVTLGATVLVDGRAIISNDEIVIRAEDWRDDHRTIQLPKWWSEDLAIVCMATEAHVDESGVLQRLWDTSSGRVCSIQVGNDFSSPLAAKVYRSIQKRGQPVSIYDLANSMPELELDQLLQLTHLLWRYELIRPDDGDDATARKG